MVHAMSDNSAAEGGSAALQGKSYVDPSGNTEAFRAFTESAPPEQPPAPAKTPLIIAGVVVAIMLIGAIVWLIA